MPFIILIASLAIAALIKDGPADSREMALRPGERPNRWI